MSTIHKDISNKILTIGPDYRNSKGGIGAVIKIYSNYFEKFKFLPSTIDGSIFNKLLFFITSISKLFLILIFDKKIKIIHIHGASNSSFWRKHYFIIIAKLFHKKVIYHCHGGGFKDFYLSSKYQKRILKTLYKCDVIVTLSESWKDFFTLELFCNKISIINNIIPYPEISIGHQHNESNVLKFLYLGHIYRAKGIFDLLEVINDNKEHYEGKMELHIGGGMFEESNLLDYIKIHTLESIIKFHGWVNGQKKTNLFNLSDIFILPSYSEGLPISILEAMSYSMPIISTPVGGIPEIVKNGENGFLINPGKKEELKFVIDNFLINKYLIKDLGYNSKIRSTIFLPKTVIKQLKELYISLLK